MQVVSLLCCCWNPWLWKLTDSDRLFICYTESFSKFIIINLDKKCPWSRFSIKLIVFEVLSPLIFFGFFLYQNVENQFSSSKSLMQIENKQILTAHSIVQNCNFFHRHKVVLLWLLRSSWIISIVNIIPICEFHWISSLWDLPIPILSTYDN